MDVTDWAEVAFMERYLRQAQLLSGRSLPLPVCPACGQGMASPGLKLLTQPELVVAFDATNLCAGCRVLFDSVSMHKVEPSLRRALATQSRIASYDDGQRTC